MGRVISILTTEQRVRGAKTEFAYICHEAIAQFFKTNEGVRRYGERARAAVCEDERTVQIECTVDGYPVVYEFTVRELLGSNK